MELKVNAPRLHRPTRLVSPLEFELRLASRSASRPRISAIGCPIGVDSGLTRTSAVLPANLNGSFTVERSGSRQAARDPQRSDDSLRSCPTAGRAPSHRIAPKPPFVATGGRPL